MSSGGARTVLIANPGAELYGSDRMVLETVTALVEDGRRVIVALPGDGPLRAELTARGAEVQFCPMPVVRKSALRPLGALRLLGDVLRSFAPSLRLIRRCRPDVVLVNTTIAPLWFLLAAGLRVPRVAHVHEGESGASPLVLKGLYAPLVLAQRLVINSEFSRGVLVAALPRLAARSVVIYNAVPAPSQVTSARRQLEAPTRLVFVGRLSPRKGPDIALAAVQLLRERGVSVHLELVGSVFPGYEWFEAQLRDFVADQALTEAVSFAGFQGDVGAFTAAADIVLVPSTLDEPFGNTAVEAVLATRPSIVSAVGGLPEAVRGFQSVRLVAAGDPALLADAVVDVIGDWPRLRAAALEDATTRAQRYSSATYGAAVRAVLDAAVIN